MRSKKVFYSIPTFRFTTKGHVAGEDLVFFVLKRNGEALIISARDMTRTERRTYGRK
jgi:uncharacterized DUF497 family protein